MLLSFSVVLISLRLTTEGVEAAFPNPHLPRRCCVVCTGDDALSSIPVPKGYTQSGVYSNLFYKFYREEISWVEAHLQCIEDGGLLAHPRNEAEAKGLLAFIKKSIIGRKGEYFYFHSGFLKWKHWFSTFSGEFISDSGFYAWEPDEPNNGSYESFEPGVNFMDEFCGSFTINGKLNDLKCFFSLKPFVCEIRLEKILLKENYPIPL